MKFVQRITPPTNYDNHKSLPCFLRGKTSTIDFVFPVFPVSYASPDLGGSWNTQWYKAFMSRTTSPWKVASRKGILELLGFIQGWCKHVCLIHIQFPQWYHSCAGSCQTWQIGTWRWIICFHLQRCFSGNTFCLLKLTVWGSNQKKIFQKIPKLLGNFLVKIAFFVCKTIFFVTQKLGCFQSWDRLQPQPVRSLLGRLGGIETRWMGLGFSEVEFCL